MVKERTKEEKIAINNLAHYMNHFLSNAKIVALADDFGKELKWPFQYFIEKEYSQDELDILVESTEEYFNNILNGFKFVGMLDIVHDLDCLRPFKFVISENRITVEELAKEEMHPTEPLSEIWIKKWYKTDDDRYLLDTHKDRLVRCYNLKGKAPTKEGLRYLITSIISEDLIDVDGNPIPKLVGRNNIIYEIRTDGNLCDQGRCRLIHHVTKTLAGDIFQEIYQEIIELDKRIKNDIVNQNTGIAP